MPSSSKEIAECRQNLAKLTLSTEHSHISISLNANHVAIRTEHSHQSVHVTQH